MRTQYRRKPTLTMEKRSDMRHSRIEKELALVLIVAIVVAMVGCKKKKAGDESDLPSILSSETETAPEETTAETTEVTATTESTAAPKTSEATPSETTEATTETSDSSETTLDPTATPTDTPADPTPTTPPTNTPTPTPTTAPKEVKKATDYKSTIQSAVKQAIIDNCGWKTGFVFDDKVMSNQKARAKYAVDNDILTHGEIPGTETVGCEACGSSGCTYDSDKDQLKWFWTDHGGQNHYYYDDPYQCYYDYAKFLVVEHTNKLSSDADHIYFGYGVAMRYCPWERSNGLGTVESWNIIVYIGGLDEFGMAAHFPT